MVRKMAGVGLSDRLVLARVDHGEALGEAEPAHHGVDEPARRRRRQRQHRAPGATEVEGVAWRPA